MDHSPRACANALLEIVPLIMRNRSDAEKAEILEIAAELGRHIA
jgi:hypothetical protein